MAQNQPQFQRPLLRIGSIAFLAGVIIAVVSTAVHPSREDPSNHPLVFAEYATSLRKYLYYFFNDIIRIG